jgi:hypothetical protein
VVCAKCGSRRNKIDVRPNWKEQPMGESLTGKQWQMNWRISRRRLNILLDAAIAIAVAAMFLSVVHLIGRVMGW